ncbi:MAG: hypothetical protein E7616_07715 [Ruminococcaceae bacterium]|nr:hypothetical protein [Oscillospiraceae bacterium]
MYSLKKISLIFLLAILLFSLCACGSMTDRIKQNLENEGYTVSISDKSDSEFFKTNAKQTIIGKKELDSITIYLYETKNEADSALQDYQAAMKDLGNALDSILIVGTKDNSLYIATTEQAVNTAYHKI